MCLLDKAERLGPAPGGGRIPGTRAASIDLPEPGGPTISMMGTWGPANRPPASRSGTAFARLGLNPSEKVAYSSRSVPRNSWQATTCSQVQVAHSWNLSGD